VATTIDRRLIPPIGESDGGEVSRALCVGLDWTGLVKASSTALEWGGGGTKLVLISAHRPRLAWTDSLAALLGIQAIDREELASAEIRFSEELPHSDCEPIWVAEYSRLGFMVESRLARRPHCALVVVGYGGSIPYLRRLTQRISARASEFCPVISHAQ
jgi:hypothetical protein